MPQIKFISVNPLQNSRVGVGLSSIIGPTGSQGLIGPTGPNEDLGSMNIYNNKYNSVATIIIQSSSGPYYGGAGFFIYNTGNFGYIATASHVIVDPATNLPANNIWVQYLYPTNSVVKVNGSTGVLGFDNTADVALLRVSGTGFITSEFANSRTEAFIGQPVTAIGYPSLFDMQSPSRGIIRDNKIQPGQELQESVLTDINIYGGNSGGPLFLDNEKVVGIMSYGLTNKDGLNGSTSSYLAQHIINYFMTGYTGTYIRYPKGYLGITAIPIDTYIAAVLNLNSIRGYYVNAVDPAISPSKFNVGDIIISVNGVNVGVLDNQYPLFTEIHLRSPGSIVSVNYLTSPLYNTIFTKNVTLETFPINKDIQFTSFLRKEISPFLNIP